MYALLGQSKKAAIRHALKSWDLHKFQCGTCHLYSYTQKPAGFLHWFTFKPQFRPLQSTCFIVDINRDSFPKWGLCVRSAGLYLTDLLQSKSLESCCGNILSIYCIYSDLTSNGCSLKTEIFSLLNVCSCYCNKEHRSQISLYVSLSIWKYRK